MHYLQMKMSEDVYTVCMTLLILKHHLHINRIPDFYSGVLLPKGLKMQLQLHNTEIFQSIGAELSPRGLPGKQRGSLYSSDYLEHLVRHQTLTGHHASCSCKMGALSDPSSVVDPNLK